jgi:hypothetical protein
MAEVLNYALLPEKVKNPLNITVPEETKGQ